MTTSTTPLRVAAAVASVEQDPNGQAAATNDTPVAVFEIITPSQPGAYGFSVRVAATRRLYRITPARDPQEPRFWGVVVYRCTPSGLPDAAERPWLGRAGLRREELREVMAAIRADVAGWLAALPSPALVQWVLAPPDPPAPAGPEEGKALRRAAAPPWPH